MAREDVRTAVSRRADRRAAGAAGGERLHADEHEMIHVVGEVGPDSGGCVTIGLVSGLGNAGTQTQDGSIPLAQARDQA